MAVRNGDEGPDIFNFLPLGDSDDNGYGQGGRDRLYGGGGNDRLFGMNDDDILFGDSGNDYLNGGRGRDVVHGGTGDDALYGYGNNDWLYGEAGNDRLFGGDNSDRLFGGSGNDQLDGVGGPGVDFLNGGSGRDVFIINYGFSYAVVGGSADQINDWNFADDRINSNIAGTAGNYTESSSNATTVVEARHHIQDSGFDGVHGFVYNSNNNTGYLVSDINNDGKFETGVTLKGAGSAASMDWSHII